MYPAKSLCMADYTYQFLTVYDQRPRYRLCHIILQLQSTPQDKENLLCCVPFPKLPNNTNRILLLQISNEQSNKISNSVSLFPCFLTKNQDPIKSEALAIVPLSKAPSSLMCSSGSAVNRTAVVPLSSSQRCRPPSPLLLLPQAVNRIRVSS